MNKISNELSKYDNPVVLGSNFVGSTFVVIFETTSYLNQKRFYLVTENCKTPKIIELPVDSDNEYVKIRKTVLFDNLDAKLIKSLAKNGYTMEYETGITSNGSTFCLHRLVACLYYNCINLEVHHIDNNVKNNEINNLLPLSQVVHNRITGTADNGLDYCILEQQKRKKTPKKYQTVASNLENALTILIRLMNKDSVGKIIKVVNGKVKKTKIYEMKKFFFYVSDFLNWFKTQYTYLSSELYGKLPNEWICIKKYKLGKVTTLRATPKVEGSRSNSELIPIKYRC